MVQAVVALGTSVSGDSPIFFGDEVYLDGRQQSANSGPPNHTESLVIDPHPLETYAMQIPVSLATELAAWNNGRGITPLRWIGLTGSFKHFIGYARLIFPEFVEINGRIYLADLFSHDRLAELGGQCTERDAQVFMNAIDLSTIFGDADAQSDHDIRNLGSFLKNAWAACVEGSFPGRRVKIILDDNLDEQGVGELLISLVDES